MVPGVLKLVLKYKPDLVLSAFNACLTARVFNYCWKLAMLVPIIKGKGNPKAPSAHRQCTVISTR